MSRIKFFTLSALSLATVGAFTFSQKGYAAADSDEEKSIQLPVMQCDLPPGKGVEAVNAACVICHSTRYITMQPAFSRKVWTAEVEKMRKTFGAPVSDEQAGQIVEYLVAVKGVPEKSAQ